MQLGAPPPHVTQQFCIWSLPPLPPSPEPPLPPALAPGLPPSALSFCAPAAPSAPVAPNTGELFQCFFASQGRCNRALLGNRRCDEVCDIPQCFNDAQQCKPPLAQAEVDRCQSAAPACLPAMLGE